MKWRLRTTLIAALSPALVLWYVALPVEGESLNSTCADLVAHALSSKATVPGSYACLGAQYQAEAAAAGYGGDAGLQQLASDRGYTSARYVGRSDLGFQVYELRGGQHSPVLLMVLVGGDGKVSRIDQDAP